MNNPRKETPVNTPAPTNRKAVVVLSGGQDSATCLLWAVNNPAFFSVSAVSFNYGQRHKIELESARDIASLLNVPHKVVDIEGLLLGSSPLVNPAAKLETYDNLEQMEAVIGDRIELTFVPLRNPVFLLVAANYALSVGAMSLVTGVCAMDNANYPDCTSGFVDVTRHLINEALGLYRLGYDGPQFQIHTPLIDKTKADTVRMAMEYPDWHATLSLSHTCYAGEVPPCGKCHACVLRASGFAEAGVPDPLVERFAV